jgi:hypothetical protein
MANNGRANIDSSNRVAFEGYWDRAPIREADAITPDLLVSLSFQRFVTREVQGQSPPATTILPANRAPAWARHHVEEIGNLGNFLPALHVM